MDYHGIFPQTIDQDFDADFSKLTTVKTGGKAKIVVSPKDEEQLACVLKTISENNFPYFVLGNGSNVLASDEGYSGVIVKIGKYLSQIQLEDGLVSVGAGASAASVATFALNSGLGGAEFLASLPATMGGAVTMNAGCFGHCVADIVEKVVAVSGEGAKEYESYQLLFDYRSSVFLKSNVVISKVFLSLQEKPKSEILQQMDLIKKTKRAAQPLDYPSFGSVFKRHDGVGAAVYIDKLGFKGFCVGGAKVSEKHANFFVNTGNATTEDFLTLIDIVGARVFQKFGVLLTTEIRYIGDKNDLGRLSYTHVV